MAKRVTTDGGSYETDVLVVALGADLAPELTPGVVEDGNEFYTVARCGARAQRGVVVRGGDVVIGVLGPFYKCPAAPYETAMMLHDALVQRGARDASTIKVLTPMGVPIPISKEASAGILAGLDARGIEFWGETVVTAIDPRDEDRDAAHTTGRPIHAPVSVPWGHGRAHELPVLRGNASRTVPPAHGRCRASRTRGTRSRLSPRLRCWPRWCRGRPPATATTPG